MKYDVVIAYDRDDSAAAETIQQHLSAAGFECYRDVTHIPGSADWVVALSTAIKECHTCLVIISAHSARSKHVRREVVLADNAGKSFVPVTLNPGAALDWMDYYFGGLQHIEAAPSLEDALPRLLKAVSGLVDESKHRPAYDDESDVRRRARYRLEPDFELDAGGLFLGTTPQGSTEVSAGSYVMSSRPDQYLGHHGVTRVSEWILSVTAREISGSDDEWFGAEFGDSWPGDYCQFLVSPKGKVRISKHVHGGWSHIADRGFKASGDKRYDLRIVRKGRWFRMFVNGLHALSTEDFDVRSGYIGLFVGRGIRVAFSDFRLQGVFLEDELRKAGKHWSRLEIREAKELLKYVVEYDPSLRLPDLPRRPVLLLNERRPDYRESILIAVGSAVLPQIHDGIPAARLRSEIDRRGHGEGFRWASVVTDEGLLAEQEYMKCPVITVGGPATNRLTAILVKEIPCAAESTEQVRIHHAIDAGNRRVALWGTGAEETAAAVGLFIASGRLDEFLQKIWS